MFLMRNPRSVSARVTQQVYVTEECVKNAHNKFEAKSNFRRDVEKAFGAAKEEKAKLVERLKISDHERSSALVGLKTVEKPKDGNA